MLKKENLKSYIDELIKEVEEELKESTATGAVDGYQTPFAFSGKRKQDKAKADSNIKVTGYTKVKDIDEAINSKNHKPDGEIDKNFMHHHKTSGYTPDYGHEAELDTIDFDDTRKKEPGHQTNVKDDENRGYEPVKEGKSKRPVNRWLELKNDDSMHANKKLAVGLRELKYQLSEVEKFFRWYNQIKTMNELSSDSFWKRTNTHIYKIKERLINIAKTIQEIEK